MGKQLDLTGMKFGRLTCEKVVGRSKFRQKLWLCRCNCGNETIVLSDNLRRNNTQSCGCLQKERAKESHTIHSERKTKLYSIWSEMKKRCFNKNSKAYKNYGGKGIKVCEEWLNYPKFCKWAKANGYLEGLSIERMNIEKDYEPGNCKWIELSEQAKNTSRNVFITFNNKTMILADWARELNIGQATLRFRLNKGWSIEKTLTTPAREMKKCKLN